MKPDECLFKAHLEEAPFQSGCDAGQWGLHGDIDAINWPNPIIWVQADKAIVATAKVSLRFTVDSYPSLAPTACPWDTEKGARLENRLWPVVTGQFAKVFRLDWHGSALYAPCDRLAMPGHEIWKAQFKEWWWSPDFTIVKYLRFVHRVLNPNRL